MIPISILEELDNEIKNLNIPFDKALPILQEKLWDIADNHNTTGDKVFMSYMDWKSSKNK